MQCCVEMLQKKKTQGIIFIKSKPVNEEGY